jgi:hypothetical protein
MTPEEFMAEFGTVITVCFNRQRFLAERWPVTVHQLADRSDFSRCFIPWYLDGAGGFIQNATPADAPLQVCTVPTRFATLPDLQRQVIQHYAQQIQQATGPIVFRIPAYTLPRGRFLVLDGNHRLSARTLFPQPFSLAVCSVDGPIDGTALMDLRYWQANPQA